MNESDRNEVARLFEPFWARGRTPAFECSDGWLGILADLARKFAALDDEVRVSQIKEKFGTLSVFTTTPQQQVLDLISEAVAASETTCELCGNLGRLGQRRYWWSTRCEQCAPEGWEPASTDDDDPATERIAGMVVGWAP